MKDGFGRNIDYLRVSVTDKCNLNCCYCRPMRNKYEECGTVNCLKPEEYAEIVGAAAELGISKVRLTGGEPLIYDKLPWLIKRIKSIPKIKQVGITTNGVMLKKKLPELLAAGIDIINVSLDTLDRMTYKKMTGSDDLMNVLDGIDGCLEAGVNLRINTVLIQDINDKQWKDIVFLAAEKPIDVRFIELMPVGFGRFANGVSNTELIKKISESCGGMSKSNYKGNGPAHYYEISGFLGKIGFINPIHGKFCADCNRLRLTADGKLKPCLCYEDAVDLSLANGDKTKLKKLITMAMELKPEGHCFGKDDTRIEHKSMSAIGG